jgi:coenzyme F420-0:L-glutamate ligase/coenzyme F420-1:gamma-L-glutamate ligase
VDAAVDAAAVRRALATVAPVVAAGTEFTLAGATVRCAPPPDAGPAGLVRFGADVHRLRAALAAEDVSTAVSDADPTVMLHLHAGGLG